MRGQVGSLYFLFNYNPRIYYSLILMSSHQLSTQVQGKHIASLTHSEMLVLNLAELQSMGTFTFDIALLDQPQPKIYAYEHAQCPNSYILVVPLIFYESTKNHSQQFVQLLCLCSNSVTYPSHYQHNHQIQSFLSKYRLVWREKRGSNVIKLYLQDHCLNSYLDLVTFQAVQFNTKIDELISMKRENAYQYCINSFREELLPYLYQNEEQSIAQALQICLNQLKDIYLGLECAPRFARIYNVMNPSSQSTLKQLQQQIAKAAISRHITTVGDEQCEELINEQLSRLVQRQLYSCQKELRRMKAGEQMVFLTKIMSNLLKTLRDYNFQINDQKYLFLNSKIIEKAYQIEGEKIALLEDQNNSLVRQIKQKQEEVQLLKKELESVVSPSSKPILSTEYRKEPAKLQIINQEAQETISTTLRTSSENKQQPSNSTITLKDLKEPLQPINTNLSVNKLRKTGLTKTKQKLKEGLKRQEDVRRQKSIKNLRIGS